MKRSNPNIVTVVQVRVGSTRMPRKVLLPLQGKQLFVRQIERILRSKLKGEVVVATTLSQDDDIIEKICKNQGLNCYRGSENDLLDRHYKAAKEYKAEAVVKIPSDCPLISPEVIDKVIEYYLLNGQFDYVSNLHPATYPDGNDVEIMSMEVLEKAWTLATKKFEREHTTPFIWDNPYQFKIGNVRLKGIYNYSMSHRWTIDYAEDYDFIKRVYDELYPSHPEFGFEDIMNLLNYKPEIIALNGHLAGINWYRTHLNELKTIQPRETKAI